MQNIASSNLVDDKPLIPILIPLTPWNLVIKKISKKLSDLEFYFCSTELIWIMTQNTDTMP